MSNNKLSKNPKIRFHGFTIDWQVSRLEEIAEVNSSSEKIPDEFMYIELGSVNNGKINGGIKISKSDAPSRAQRVLNQNDILFQTVRPYLRNNYFHCLKGNYVASTGYAQIRTKQNSKFLYYYLFTEEFMTAVSSRSTGTSYPAINSSELKKISVWFPEILEQEKISTFLTQIDEWINSLRKQKTEFEKYKKGVLQKIFSQKIRFKDKNNQPYPSWERRVLEQYLVEHNEKTTKNNQYPVLTSSQRGIFLQKDYFAGNDVASADTTGYNVVPRGYFTYRHMSDTLVFKFNINTLVDKGIVSTLYPVFTTKNINNDFLLLTLNEGDDFKRYAVMQKQGGSRTYMYYSKLKKMEVNLPCLDEQKKIVNFVSAIDSLLLNKKKQIELAEKWKKGLLQQMFV